MSQPDQEVRSAATTRLQGRLQAERERIRVLTAKMPPETALTLGSVVLAATFVTAWRNSRGR